MTGRQEEPKKRDGGEKGRERERNIIIVILIDLNRIKLLIVGKRELLMSR